jgi:hypothetical protein
MTPKQEERIRNKIAKIRKALAADKQRWGGFHHDGRGLRYLPPELFIKLRDYKGGLRYLRWFDRTFSDDSGFPLFLFEWTFILYKTGNVKEAEKKAFKTFDSHYYIFDAFLGNEFFPEKKNVNSDSGITQNMEDLPYSNSDPEFADFAEWLEEILTSDKFSTFANELIEIEKKLETEPVGETRTELVNRQRNLIDEK